MPPADASAPSIGFARLPSAARLPEFSERLELRFDAEREQLPLWLPVGLGTGIAAWFSLPDSHAWIAFLLGSAAATVALLAFAGRLRWGRSMGIFLMAAVLGCALIWVKAERAAAPRLERPQIATFSARVEAVELLPARSSVRLLLAPQGAPTLPPRVRVSIDEKHSSEAFQPGAILSVRARLMPPAPMAVPGAYDFARVAWFERIGATGRAIERPTIVAPAQEQAWGARLNDWRMRLSAHIRSRVGGGEGAIAAAFATGDQGAVPDADAEAMRRSGLAHLLSISGLHVVAVVGAAMLLTIKLLALSPALALRWPLILIGAAVGATCGVAYTLFTGAEVPTVRACIAALLVLAGIALGRDAITLRLVATGALIVLILFPEALAGPSFQLSFAAVTAIVALHEYPRARALLARREEGVIRRAGRILLSLLLTGIAVEGALAPIALYHFHQTGLYGALANIVAIPLTTFVIMPLEALALLLDVAGMGAPLWWLCERALGLLLGLAHVTAAAPGATAMLPSVPPGAFALMVGGGLWLCLWRTGWRALGGVPIAAGAIWALATPAPDLIVTGDGRHLALRTGAGELAILRGKAGDYVRDILAESSGTEAELLSLEDHPSARCSADLCSARVVKGGRTWHILATRSPHFVLWRDMVRACAAADIVVADRRLPAGCQPRWLKADRALLSRTGGMAITLNSNPRVTTVADRVGRHPWATAGNAQ